MDCPDLGGDDADADDDSIIVDPGCCAFPEFHTGASWSQQGLIAFADRGTNCVVRTGVYNIDPALRGIWILDPDTGVKERVVDRGWDPSWSPDGTRIAFDYLADIFVVELEGGRVTRLTDRGRNFFPAWSPDGSWIAYDRSAEIWLVRPDATANHKIQVDALSPIPRRMPAWHPESSMIVHVGYVSGERDIYEMSVDGGRERHVAQRPGIDRDPTYSFDGQWIAFVSLIFEAEPYASQIWIMRADGTDQRQLTVCGGVDPSWSPDGTRIVYTKYRHEDGSPENGVLWLIDVRSQTEKQLTFHPPCDQ